MAGVRSNKLFLIVFFTFFPFFLKAQKSLQIIACENDTVYLSTDKLHGNALWQYSSDSINWLNDTLSTDTLMLIASESGFYRALIYDGSCDTIFSDTIQLTVYPAPTQAHAGSDQLNLQSVSMTLSANEALAGQGLWQIISGTGGQLSDPLSHNAVFSGIGAHAYTLVWSIGNECRTTYDTVNISFRLPQISCAGTTLYIHPVDNSGSAIWGCQGTLTNATSEMNGSQNTVLINTACADPTIAAKKCSELTAYGHNDWYLPAKDELDCLYQERFVIGSFFTSSGMLYWSSTESNATWAVAHNFNNGQVSAFNQKQGACRARCVRRD